MDDTKKLQTDINLLKEEINQKMSMVSKLESDAYLQDIRNTYENKILLLDDHIKMSHNARANYFRVSIRKFGSINSVKTASEELIVCSNVKEIIVLSTYSTPVYISEESVRNNVTMGSAYTSKPIIKELSNDDFEGIRNILKNSIESLRLFVFSYLNPSINVVNSNVAEKAIKSLGIQTVELSNDEVYLFKAEFPVINGKLLLLPNITTYLHDFSNSISGAEDKKILNKLIDRVYKKIKGTI